MLGVCTIPILRSLRGRSAGPTIDGAPATVYAKLLDAGTYRYGGRAP